jgi:ABC-type multidrug transport system fused ATPase/permease subunit
MGSGRRLVLAGFGLIVVDAFAQISAPAVFRIVLNDIQRDPDAFVDGGWRAPAGLATLVASTFLVAAYLAHTFTRRGAAHWANHLRCRLYEHIQLLSVDFARTWRVGDVAARINQDIERLELAVLQALAVIWSTVMLLAGIALIAWVSAWMAVSSLALLAVALAWTALVMPRLRRTSRSVRDEMGATSARVTELVGATPLIKSFNAEPHTAGAVARDSQRVLLGTEALARLQFRYSDLMGFHLAFVAPFVLLFAAAWRAAEGTLLIGDVVAVWAIWQRASGALTMVVNNVPELLSGLAAGERAAELLWERPTVVDRPHAPGLQVVAAAVSFDDVHFAYPGRPDHAVLQGLDLALSGGERVALVGPSGTGKSTVAQLLLRFYDPQTGAIRIDGQDLRSVDQSSLRAKVGVVFQDNVLIRGSLASNLRLANPDASDAELQATLEAAHAWEFVSRWPEGLETHVGDRGMLLSGGQRQRLAVARVMLKNPPIIVLDEATSALDAESERLVSAALDQLMSGRTSLVIAHRIATVRHADRIAVLEEGRVAAIGSHDELLSSSSTYSGYCRQQHIA